MPSFLSQILKPVAAIAGLVPGGQLIGAGLGALDSALTGAGNQRRADRLNDQSLQEANQMVALYNQFGPQLFQSLLNNIGFDSTTGKFSSTETRKPAYDVDALIRLSDEDAARAAMKASGNLSQSMRNDGFVGGTGYDLARGQIFAGQQANSADAARRIRATAEQEEWQRQQQTQNNRQGQLQTALSFLTNGRNLGLSTMGGMGGLFASKADANAQGLGQTLQALFQTGALKLPQGPGARGPNAGNANLDTNQAGAPLPSFGGISVLNPATPPTFGGSPVFNSSPLPVFSDSRRRFGV